MTAPLSSEPTCAECDHPLSWHTLHNKGCVKCSCELGEQPTEGGDFAKGSHTATAGNSPEGPPAADSLSSKKRVSKWHKTPVLGAWYCWTCGAYVLHEDTKAEIERDCLTCGKERAVGNTAQVPSNQRRMFA